jgi:hypothetical protein
MPGAKLPLPKLFMGFLYAARTSCFTEDERTKLI